MKANELWLDILKDNQKRIHWILREAPSACLYWRPDGAGNSIAQTIWHTGRILDLFLTRHIRGLPGEAELWASRDWSSQTGYDPYGIGHEGWGTIQGYTPADVAAIPEFTQAQLQGYFDEVIDFAGTILSDLSETDLESIAPGGDGTRTVTFWLRLIILDLTRHTGEMLAIMAMWQRANPTEEENA